MIIQWKFDNERPIYIQLVEKLKVLIFTGHYQPNQQMPSVRELAQLTKVNPNTVQKAYLELENINLIETRRTHGKFVTEEVDIINNLKTTLAKDYTSNYVENMKNLNYDVNEIINFINENEREM